MGHGKLENVLIEKKGSRKDCFNKRNRGILKKLYQLAYISGCGVHLVIEAEDGNVYEFHRKMNPALQKAILQASLQNHNHSNPNPNPNPSPNPNPNPNPNSNPNPNPDNNNNINNNALVAKLLGAAPGSSTPAPRASKISNKRMFFNGVRTMDTGLTISAHERLASLGPSSCSCFDCRKGFSNRLVECIDPAGYVDDYDAAAAAADQYPARSISAHDSIAGRSGGAAISGCGDRADHHDPLSTASSAPPINVAAQYARPTANVPPPIPSVPAAGAFNNDLSCGRRGINYGLGPAAHPSAPSPSNSSARGINVFEQSISPDSTTLEMPADDDDDASPSDDRRPLLSQPATEPRYDTIDAASSKQQQDELGEFGQEPLKHCAGMMGADAVDDSLATVFVELPDIVDDMGNMLTYNSADYSNLLSSSSCTTIVDDQFLAGDNDLPCLLYDDGGGDDHMLSFVSKSAEPIDSYFELIARDFESAVQSAALGGGDESKLDHNQDILIDSNELLYCRPKSP